MKITKQDIISQAHNTRKEDLANDSWRRSYNLRWKCGEYTLSIGVGDGLYCHPRKVLEDVSEYTEVECAILRRTGGLLSLEEVINTFGHGVGAMCEGYDYRNHADFLDSPMSNTVLPYITWEQVEMVANRMWAVEDASYASGC